MLAGAAPANLRRACRMADALVHRGPDEQGSFCSEDGRCAIGFRRLAVIDPERSQQPMSLPDGSLTVAFNGEIYNFCALRAELQADGARFLTAGDTEVLLHLYRRDAEAMVNRLEGMFAFALYDSRAAKLVLARDRLGQKPLWYAALRDRVVFASEAKALLLHPDVPKCIRPESLSAYISIGYIPSPATAWSSVRKLRPAHMLEAQTLVGAERPYWAPPSDAPDDGAGDPVALVRDLLPRAVEARMLADVPLGALLSGGVDSAVVVALMCRAAGRGGGVRTFTAGFAESLYDERDDALLAARHCGTDHTSLLIEPPREDLLDRIVNMYDEPFADSSAIPTWLICRAAREHVTVALTGDGGDEAFGGYDRYRAMHLAQTMGPAKYAGVKLAAWLVRPFASHEQRSRLRRLVRFADSLNAAPSMQYWRLRRLFGPEDLTRLFTAEFAEGMDLASTEEWFCNLYEQGDFESEATYAQRHDVLTYLPDDLLVKADIASMASSLELRSPMLDHRVVSLGLSLPVSAKLDGRRGKKILQAAFGDLLPREVFDRPKRGFGVPLARWLREELRETMLETLLDKGFLGRGIFREEAIAGLVNDHLSRRDDHSHRLWALMVLARWLGRHGCST